MFEKDILLDEDAFDTAVTEFADLSTRLQKLRGRLEEMISTLQTGFNTPAGRKFVKSCKNNLFDPMDDQKAVFEHIANTLQGSREAYKAVFTEYEELNSAIDGVDD